MPHFPKPFFRSARSAWFVQIHGKQINLGVEREEAFRRYHELMSRANSMHVPTPSRGEHIVVLLDSFLDFVQKNRSSETYRWYKDRLELFCNSIDPSLTVEQIKPFHVQQWIDSYPDLRAGTKRNYCRSIMRVMTWAEEQGHVDRSPLANFKKPPAGKREQPDSHRHSPPWGVTPPIATSQM